MGTRKSLIFKSCANCGIKIEDDERAISIDYDADLVFCTELCLQEYFGEAIDRLEEEHLRLRSEHDVQPIQFPEYEYILAALLKEPDEVWEEPSENDSQDYAINYFIGEFLHKREELFYVAAVYLAEDKPAFVFMHFPTVDERLVAAYRRGYKIYDSRSSEQGEDLSPTTVSEVDDFASQLHEDLLAHRQDWDIELDEFAAYSLLISETLEDPDEIWQTLDEEGQAYDIFIGQFEREGEKVAMVVVLQAEEEVIEEENEESQRILFSMPTQDENLLNRARLGKQIFKKLL